MTYGIKLQKSGVRRVLRGVGSPGAAAPVLCLLGVSWLSCVAEVPPSSSAPGVIARFDPAASPAVVPAPTDLVRVGGSLQIPVNPAEDKVGALKTFNTYLRSLDGFPPDSEASTTFSDKVDPSSLGCGVAGSRRRVVAKTESNLIGQTSARCGLVLFGAASDRGRGRRPETALLEEVELSPLNRRRPTFHSRTIRARSSPRERLVVADSSPGRSRT